MCLCVFSSFLLPPLRGKRYEWPTYRQIGGKKRRRPFARDWKGWRAVCRLRQRATQGVVRGVPLIGSGRRCGRAWVREVKVAPPSRIDRYIYYIFIFPLLFSFHLFHTSLFVLLQNTYCSDVETHEFTLCFPRPIR